VPATGDDAGSLVRSGPDWTDPTRPSLDLTRPWRGDGEMRSRSIRVDRPGGGRVAMRSRFDRWVRRVRGVCLGLRSARRGWGCRWWSGSCGSGMWT